MSYKYKISSVILVFAIFLPHISSHCFIELSESQTVYWSIFYFPVFHVLAHSIQNYMCTNETVKYLVEHHMCLKHFIIWRRVWEWKNTMQ